MAEVKEIRLHGRGGQGTVKASEIVVHAAVAGGMYANSIPYFGFERRGAPVSAFVRISSQPIRPKTQVYRPHCVVVLDETLTNAVDVFEGMVPGAVLVLNSKQSPDRIPVPAAVGKLAVVDATGLALELLGRAVPNTVMLGAFCRATGWVSVEEVAGRAAEVFGPRNALAVRRGYELAQLDDAVPGSAATGLSAAWQRPREVVPRAVPLEAPGVGSARSDKSLVAWPATGKWEAPVGVDLYVIRTGDWRSHRPVWDLSLCNGCGICLISCPVGALSFCPPPQKGSGRRRRVVKVDLTYCKGCGICAHECPSRAVSMIEEGVKGA